MKEYLVTANEKDSAWWEDFHIKGLKVNTAQDQKTIITASDSALAEIKLKHPDFKIELILD